MSNRPLLQSFLYVYQTADTYEYGLGHGESLSGKVLFLTVSCPMFRGT